jgi:hypothetical protein
MASELTKARTGSAKRRQSLSARSNGRPVKRSRPGPAAVAAAEVDEEAVAGVRDHVEDGGDLLLAVGDEEAAVVEKVLAVVLAPGGRAVRAGVHALAHAL